MNTNSRRCELCREWFDEDKVNLIKVDDEDTWVCEDCEEELNDVCRAY